MSDPVMVILTTVPDQPVAERLAGRLVETKLAACVNILGPVTSVYTWKGQIERDTEYQLLIKAPATLYSAVERLIQQEHPYELPEILALGVSRGLSSYIEWINSCTKQ